MKEKIIDNICSADPKFSELKSVCEKIDFLNDSSIKKTLYIMMLMKQLQNNIINHMDRQLKYLDLTASQFDIILFLISNDDKEINQKDIENEFNLKNPTVTGLLKRLEMKGFVKRYANEHDGRYKRIVLTEKSQFLRDSINDSISEYSRIFFKGITDKEKSALIDILIKLNRNINFVDKNIIAPSIKP